MITSSEVLTSGCFNEDKGFLYMYDALSFLNNIAAWHILHNETLF
jgi:hypothetical protein